MTVKQLFDSAKKLSLEIRALSSALDRISADIPEGSAKMLSERNELNANINSRITRLFEIKQDIFSVIGAVKNENERVVLILHYVNNMTFEAVAEEMGYDERYIYKLHNKALASAQKVMDFEKKTATEK